MELDTGEPFKLSYGMAGTWVFTVQAWGLGQGPVPAPEVEGRAWRSAGQPDGVAGPLTRGCECHSQLLKHTSSQEAGPSPSPSHTQQPFLGFYS